MQEALVCIAHQKGYILYRITYMIECIATLLYNIHYLTVP